MTRVRRSKKAASTTIKERACPKDKRAHPSGEDTTRKKNLEHMQNRLRWKKGLAPVKGAKARRRAPQCKAGDQVMRHRPPY